MPLDWGGWVCGLVDIDHLPYPFPELHKKIFIILHTQQLTMDFYFMLHNTRNSTFFDFTSTDQFSHLLANFYNSRNLAIDLLIFMQESHPHSQFGSTMYYIHFILRI